MCCPKRSFPRKWFLVFTLRVAVNRRSCGCFLEWPGWLPRWIRCDREWSTRRTAGWQSAAWSVESWLVWDSLGPAYQQFKWELSDYKKQQKNRWRRSLIMSKPCHSLNCACAKQANRLSVHSALRRKKRAYFKVKALHVYFVWTFHVFLFFFRFRRNNVASGARPPQIFVSILKIHGKTDNDCNCFQI